ncbi:MAG: LptF/LptG family permease [Verrucomicrobiota bacterium]
MKTLHLYITRQVLLTLLMTVTVFTFVLLLGNVMKEILALLVARQITFSLVLRAIGLLIPYVLGYVLPFGMLTATLLVFGRFSADHELTAVRASGISLLSLIAPVLVLALLLSGLCAAVNLYLAPMSRAEYRNLVYVMGSKNMTSLLTEDRFIDEIPGLVLYVRKKNGNEIEDIRLYSLETNQITSRTSAERGRILWDEKSKQISFQLFNGVTEFRIEKKEKGPDFIGPPTAQPLDESDWQPVHFGETTSAPYDLTPLFRSARKIRLSDMSFDQLRDEREDLRAKGISDSPARVQMHRQVSFSFACFSFALVGIPLAIRAHRKETSIGIAISLMLVLLYYTFFILGEALSMREKLHPVLILWAPNFLFQAIGGYLLYRANKSGS